MFKDAARKDIIEESLFPFSKVPIKKDKGKCLFLNKEQIEQRVHFKLSLTCVSTLQFLKVEINQTIAMETTSRLLLIHSGFYGILFIGKKDKALRKQITDVRTTKNVSDSINQQK